MRSVAILALIALGCHAGSGVVEPPRAAPVGDGAIKGAIEQWRQAYEVRSLDTLGKSYVRDASLIVVQEGQALIGWPAVEALLKEQLPKATAIRVRLKDVQIQLLVPDVAVVIATMTRESTQGAATATEAGTLTLVFHHTADGWLIAVEHFSYKAGA